MSEPKALSKGGEAFSLHCRVEGIEPTPEFRFHPERKWRADFYLPEINCLVEIDGGTWRFGRHNRPAGYATDCEKLNAATKLGFRVLRFTTDMVMAGTEINDVLEIYGRKPR